MLEIGGKVISQQDAGSIFLPCLDRELPVVSFSSSVTTTEIRPFPLALKKMEFTLKASLTASKDISSLELRV